MYNHNYVVYIHIVDQRLHPPVSDYSVLLVRLFGISVKYHPSGGPKKRIKGTVTSPDNEPISLSYKTPLGWGVVRLFRK